MSKISNKPDHGANSPLKATSFPVDLSLFKVSQASSNNKKSTLPTEKTTLHFSSTKRTEAQPNLFQYNDRSPLIFSSDEEDNMQPHFNYFPNAQNIVSSQHNVSPFVLDSNRKGQKNAEYKENQAKESQVQLNKESLSIKDLLSQQQPIKNGLAKQNNNKKEIIALQKTYHIPVNSKINPLKIQSNSSQNIIPLPKKHNPDTELIKIVQHPPIQKQKSNGLNVSQSENAMPNSNSPYLRDSQAKQSSSLISKTDEIIDRVKFKQNDSILIQQQSDRSSQNKPQPPYDNKPYQSIQEYPKATIRDSSQSNPGTQRRRRNRIFDNGSSIKNKSKKCSVTPEKGVQTQGNFNNSFNGSIQNQSVVGKEYDYYPQIKALNVLDKIVDQINPRIEKNIRRDLRMNESFTDIVQKCIEEIQNANRAFNSIVIIDKIEELSFMKTRKEVRQKAKDLKGKISKLRTIKIDQQLAEQQERIYSNFEHLYRQFQVLDSSIQSYINTKQSLNRLMENTKSFMVNLKRGQLKKIYCILKEMGTQIETLKETKATCGDTRFQRMYREYLQGEIRQLMELDEQMRQNVDRTMSDFKR